jgi:DNA-nicking Smr family endonuclease
MKAAKPEGFHRPFETLGALLRVHPSHDATAPTHARSATPEPAVDEEALFFEAMDGVRRMRWNGAEHDRPKAAPAETARRSDGDELHELRCLVNSGRGFKIADTPEYMEGVAAPAPPEITRRLHRGDFSVQAHLDLHGFSAAAAQEAFDAFMREALATGKRAVLIIHGRGLSSPALPVLKTRVAEWLMTGRWRKWVVAFASARRCDGGSGASYVLLRRRPVPKRLRRRSRLRAPLYHENCY